MAKIECKNCEYGRTANMPRNGNGGSAYRGSFSEQAYLCSHPKPHYLQQVIFYGKTSPKYCPRKFEKENNHG